MRPLTSIVPSIVASIVALMCTELAEIQDPCSIRRSPSVAVRLSLQMPIILMATSLPTTKLRPENAHTGEYGEHAMKMFFEKKAHVPLALDSQLLGWLHTKSRSAFLEVGRIVGLVVGRLLGCLEGRPVGCREGCREGWPVGCREGCPLGWSVGERVPRLGCELGCRLGCVLGWRLG